MHVCWMTGVAHPWSTEREEKSEEKEMNGEERMGREEGERRGGKGWGIRERVEVTM